MRQFINHQLLAPNVLTVRVDPSVVAEFSDHHKFQGSEWALVSPKWDSDIQWVSASNRRSFKLFQSAFDRLEIADYVLPYVDVDRAVRLYAGFLVIRNKCHSPNLHVDWCDAKNQAFTMITPVSGHVDGFGLLYRKLTGEVANYNYSSGEAIMFGDHFLHSTSPGESDQPVVLLSFVFGTDQMQDWGRIYRTIGKQTPLLCQPDGEFVETGVTFRVL